MLTSGYKEGLPSWEIIVIPLENERTGIALKIHHALADGYSILHILDKLTNNESPYLVKDFTDGLATHVRQIVEAPLNLGRLAGNPGENPFRVVLAPDRKPEWMLSFTSFPLQTLKEIRRKCDVHMASVILAIVTGALRTFLLETGMKEGDMPKNVLAGMTLPWPRHPSRNPRTLNRDKMCNHWVVAMLNLPLKETDNIQRLKVIEENLCDFQSTGLDRLLERVMRPVMWALPSSVLGKMVSGDTGSGLGLTSLVGGDDYKLLNHNVERIHPFIAFHDNNPYLPLSCFTFTHSGKVELTMGAHPSVFKDQDTLDNICHKLCHNELEAILRAVK